MAALTGRNRAIGPLLPLLLLSIVVAAGMHVLPLFDQNVNLPYPPLNCRPDAADMVREVGLDALLLDQAASGCSGRRLRVRGFLDLEFEGHSLSVSREAVARNRMGFWNDSQPDAIAVRMPVEDKLRRQFDQRNVIVEGTFYLNADADYQLRWRGEIRDVVEIDYQTLEDMALPVPLVPGYVSIPDPRVNNWHPSR